MSIVPWLSVWGVVCSTPLALWDLAWLVLEQVFCMLFQPLWIHVYSCPDYSKDKAFLHTFIASDSYTLSAPSSTMIAEPWERSCIVYVLYSAEIPHFLYLGQVGGDGGVSVLITIYFN